MNNDMEIQREAIIEIVGTQYDGRAGNHKGLQFQQKLIMQHQTGNPHDPNAVMLLTADGKALGFLPMGYASLYAPAIDSGRYTFSVEVAKAEYDAERPILIVRVISEFNHRSEAEAERSILLFVQNIVNGCAQRKAEYLDFVTAENVTPEAVISVLNKVRLLQRLYALSEEIIAAHQIVQTAERFVPFTKQSLLKTLEELQADIHDLLKKIQKAYNESLDIDDEDEYRRVQSEIRERRKVFRVYDGYLTGCRDAVENYAVIRTGAAQTQSPVPEQPPAVTAPPEPQLPAPLSEDAFYRWLIAEGKASDTAARQHIANVHSIEKLYQTEYGVRKKLLGAASAEDAKVMIGELMQRKAYAAANARRNNSFSAALEQFAAFAGIPADVLPRRQTADAPAAEMTPAPPKTEQPAQQNDAEQPVSAAFKPEAGADFVLRDAVIELLNSDAPEIAACREYNNGISSNQLRRLLREHYGKTVGLFELSRLLLTDNTFQPVGKGCYIVNARFSAQVQHEPENVPENAPAAQHTEPETPPPAETVQGAESGALTIGTIIEIMRQNSGKLQYEYGFGSYEIKTLLAGQGIADAAEDTIEALMAGCDALKEIEDGYYVLADAKTAPAAAPVIPAAVPQKPPAVQHDEPVVPQQTVSGTGGIILRLNGSTVRAYDENDALAKVCELAINFAPFRMARIAGQEIRLNGKNVFYRRAVPVDGCQKLSNGLQLTAIHTAEELRTVTDAVKQYCQIRDDMIMIGDQ